MTVQKFRSNSFFVGRRHRFATTKIYGNMKTQGSKVLIGFSSICDRKTPKTVSANTIQTEGVGHFS